MINFVEPDRSKAIFLDRVDDTPQPSYVVAKTRCMYCQAWCWLGPKTFKVVNAGEATPYCTQCDFGKTFSGVPLTVVNDD